MVSGKMMVSCRVNGRVVVGGRVVRVVVNGSPALSSKTWLAMMAQQKAPQLRPPLKNLQPKPLR